MQILNYAVTITRKTRAAFETWKGAAIKLSWSDIFSTDFFKKDLFRLFAKPEAFFHLPRSCKKRRLKNPLPEAFPGLYGEEKADVEHVLTISSHARELAAELFRDCLPPELIPHFLHNLDIVLSLPMVEKLLSQLPRIGMDQFYRRALILSLLFQGCIHAGTSESARNLATSLPYILLGICLRHVEAPNLSSEARRTLLSEREFDLSIPQEIRLREQLFAQIRDIEEKMLAQRGFKRFVYYAKPGGKNLLANIAAAILRYSGRLTGRTATLYSRDILWRIPSGVIYLELLDNVAAAWGRHRKPPMLVLAEEYARLRTASQFISVGELSSRSKDAFEDLMKLFGVELLPDFQGSGRPAFYMPGQNLLACAEVRFSDVATRNVAGGARVNRVSRRLSGRRSARVSGRLRLKTEDEKELLLAESEQKRSQQFICWRCYEPLDPIRLESRRKLEAENKGYIIDPPMARLLPVSFEKAT